MIREALTEERLRALEPRDAAAMFVARRAEGLTSSEQQLLGAWLASDAANQRWFESADRAWASFAGAGNDEILAAMRAHARAPRPRAFATRWQAVAAAAILVLVVGTSMWVIPDWRKNPLHPPQQGASTAIADIHYATARGEVRELKLPDGSGLTLDADSVLVTHFAATDRKVELQRGRALFAVEPDRSRPFAVTAAGRTIVALGTRFDVNVVPDGLTVTLLEGHVSIAAVDGAGSTVRLEPGQQYVERLGQSTVRILGAASENAIGWQHGVINFDDQPLSEAAAVMNRYTTQEIVVRDPTVASLRVSGQFRAGEAGRFAATLAEMYPLRVVSSDRQIELVRSK